MPSLSDYEAEEQAASAKAMLNDPVFSVAMADLTTKYMDNLMQSDVGSQEAAAAHAGLKVLRDFKASLEAMITEKKMRDHRGTRRV